MLSRWFMPAVGSSRRRREGCSARARTISSLRWSPYGREVAGAEAPATSLPYGDQRRLEIVRALALGPSLLLLDEPTAGMNIQESMVVLDLIRRIRDRYSLTIVLVEHNMPLVMQLCERIQVLNYGQIISEGTPEKVRTDPKVVESYLGQVDEDAEARIG